MQSVKRAVETESLERCCERNLVEAARAQRRGSRQQVRAAARRFIKRHRLNAGYLRWVLRRVAANAAFAVALLGLGPSAAAQTIFEIPGGGGNPLQPSCLVSSYRLAPAFADLDADGDTDLLIGEGYGAFRFCENTGSVTSPAFLERTGAANPLNGQDLGYTALPSFGDLDGDGDLDLVAGRADLPFAYFENTGSVTSPVFVLRTGAQNPLDGLLEGVSASPALGDLDGDGDLDVLVGGSLGTVAYLENTGTSTSPAFVSRTGAQNPLDGENVGFSPRLALSDADSDGDLDLIAGELYGSFVYYENTGNAANPTFVERTSGSSALFGENVGTFPAPAFADVDGDGDGDLVAGSSALTYYENLAGSFVQRTSGANPLNGFDLVDHVAPSLADLDADGDLDMISGRDDGLFSYFENTGTPSVPAFVFQSPSANPLAGEDVGNWSMPAIGDLDDDGDLDVVSGNLGATAGYFENTGTASSANFVALAGAANPVDGLSLRNPTLGDLDDDGDLDIVSGQTFGDAYPNPARIRYFENTGDPTNPSFIERTGPANPLDSVNLAERTKPSLADLDGDGDLDLLVGADVFGFGNVSSFNVFYENVGSPSAPTFLGRVGSASPFFGQFVPDVAVSTFGDLDGDGDPDHVVGNLDGMFFYYESAVFKPLSPSVTERTGATNPLDGANGGTPGAPALGDLDGDGDQDLVTGGGGPFRYFENTGDVNLPNFVLRTGAANPLDGESGGSNARPALGDLDGDGDLDLLGGRIEGTFSFHENTGDATAPAFTLRTGSANPMDAESVAAGFSTATLGDVDGDGDLDLFSGDYDGVFHYYENTGDASVPAFTARTGSTNPLDGVDLGRWSTPAFSDFDGDGDLDILSGEYDGDVFYFENTGSATSPTFVQRTGLENPFDGENQGNFSAPVLADLNGDGDPDVVAAEFSGSFRTYYDPEPSLGLLLGAGLAWLRGLARLRRGRAVSRRRLRSRANRI